MKSFEFNLGETPGYITFDNPSSGLNPSDCMTVETLCVLLGDGQDATIFSLPASENWQEPFVAWRLGFHGQSGLPEFQVTVVGEALPTTARSAHSVGQYELVHLAGTYDGSELRLYVNGKLEAQVTKTGKIIQSQQKPTMGARSSTSVGGLFIGRLYEVRSWEIARTATDIDAWKDKTLALPGPKGLAGLWKAQTGLDGQQATQLLSQGFSTLEIAFASFVTTYVEAYSELANDALSGLQGNCIKMRMTR